MIKEINIKVKLSGDDIQIPYYKNIGDSGFDLRSGICTYVEFGKITKIPTGLYFELPDQNETFPFTLEMQIRPRSGLAAKEGIMVVNGPGTIDNIYRGEIIVLLTKCKNDDKKFFINKGERIAQAVICPVFCSNIINFIKVDELNETERGDRGFGSSGLK